MMQFGEGRVRDDSILLDLNGTWALQKYAPGSPCDDVFEDSFIPMGWMPANVPGDVHDALQDAGYIDGYYMGKKLDDLRWIDEQDWLYYRRFRVPRCAGKVYLRFEGIDTLSEIYLNGVRIGETDNMFVPWEACVDDLLRFDGDNTLLVRVKSSLIALADIDRTELFPKDELDRLVLRKSQMNYGWDFCGHYVSIGIWKGVSLYVKAQPTLQDVYLRTLSIEDGKATLGLSARIAAETPLTDAKIRLTLSEEGREVLCQCWPASGDLLTADLPSPRLWWPHSYGESFLYGARVELLDGDAVVDTFNTRLGVRTITLDQSKIEVGGRRFAFCVNGRNLFIRGANWVPTHAIYADMTDENTRFFLSRALDANITMLRIWGGGIYETEAFYDYCDEHGILIMQDFMMACGILPQEDWYFNQVAAEAKWIVKHLRVRPCIAVWSGDNEIDDAYSWYGLADQFATNRLNRVAVGDAIREFDPGRPFMVSSPFSPFPDEEGGDKPNSTLQGDMHVYLTRFASENPGYYKKLLDFVPRYVSEYGFSSLPNRNTFDKFNFYGEKMYPKRNPWLGELKAFDDMGEDKDPQRLIDFSQYSHARGLKYWIEYLRSHKGVCGGSMYWKFNDPWAPSRENMLFATLMAAIDFIGYPKAPYYTARRAYEDMILAFCENKEGELAVMGCNETLEADEGKLCIEVVGMGGGTRVLYEGECRIEADAATELYRFKPDAELAAMRDGYLRARFTGKRCLVNRFLFGDIADYIGQPAPATQLDVKVLSQDDASMKISITSSAYAQDVILTVLDRECLFSDNVFEMDAGETREIEICLPRERRPGTRIHIRAMNAAAQCVDWQ